MSINISAHDRAAKIIEHLSAAFGAQERVADALVGMAIKAQQTDSSEPQEYWHEVMEAAASIINARFEWVECFPAILDGYES